MAAKVQWFHQHFNEVLETLILSTDTSQPSPFPALPPGQKSTPTPPNKPLKEYADLLQGFSTFCFHSWLHGGWCWRVQHVTLGSCLKCASPYRDIPAVPAVDHTVAMNRLWLILCGTLRGRCQDVVARVFGVVAKMLLGCCLGAHAQPVSIDSLLQWKICSTLFTFANTTNYLVSSYTIYLLH